MYKVCPHISVPDEGEPGLVYDARALAIERLPMERLRHLANCLTEAPPPKGCYNLSSLKRAIVTVIAERTFKHFARGRLPPLTDDGVEEHYSEVFKEFGLERRKAL